MTSDAVLNEGASSEAVTSFEVLYDFPLDDFQAQAIAHLDARRSVLVCAPTGAGKTVVGEFACHAALTRHAPGEPSKCFYTTPIKALSNQKFRDLQDRYGPDAVGLLTGDRSVNGDAPIVVMTTEVLRNMLYAGSPTLRGLRHVVLDEVHYLANRERGAVWEEVIIQLADDVSVAALSATVSNAEEFGDWLDQARGGCEVVISEDRPVPLTHHYFVNGRVYDTFRTSKRGKGDRDAAKQARSGTPNPDVLMLERRAGTSHRDRRGRQHRNGPRLRWPSREEVVDELANRRWLPAILFVFSRRGCEDAVDQLLRAGPRLTNRDEAAEIRALIDTVLADIPTADLDTLDHGRFVAALERGVAAHHAGMVPAFKEAVEVCFQKGLLKVVVATETLALGINMPARTVVLERLEKWDGNGHVMLTPGEYTQLTGRAGRRGIDDRGHAVVLHQRGISFRDVAGLVGTRSYPLRSSFAPTYNMAVNLLAMHTREEAERLLGQSFAQFQADRSVSGNARRIAEYERGMDGYAEHLVSSVGDWSSYWALRRALSRQEKDGAKARRRARSRRLRDDLSALAPGDVLHLPWVGHRGVAVVADARTNAKGDPLLHLVADDRSLVRLGTRDLEVAPAVIDRLRLPNRGHARQKDFRRTVAHALRGVDPPDGLLDAAGNGHRGPDPEVARLRDEMQAHPSHRDPDRAEIEKWQYRHDELFDKAERLRRDTDRRTGSIVRRFTALVGVLERLGYLEPDTDDHDELRPTAAGRLLAGIHNPNDLLVAEALRRGVFDGLDHAELAGLAGYLLYEPRGGEGPPFVDVPTEALDRSLDLLEATDDDLAAAERAAGVRSEASFDAGFVGAAYRWARGATLEDAIETLDMTGGDFVRTMRQVADLLGQVRGVAMGDGRTGLATAAARSRDAVRRGIVEQ